MTQLNRKGFGIGSKVRVIVRLSGIMNWKPALLQLLWRSVIYVVGVLGFIFFVLGTMKLHGLFFSDGHYSVYLTLSNPVFPFISNRVVLGSAALLEIWVGYMLIAGKGRPFRGGGLLLWMCVVILAYRFLLRFIDYQGPCGCLFGINILLPLDEMQQRTLSDFVVIIGFFAGLLATILEHYRSIGVNVLRQEFRGFRG